VEYLNSVLGGMLSAKCCLAVHKIENTDANMNRLDIMELLNRSTLNKYYISSRDIFISMISRFINTKYPIHTYEIDMAIRCLIIFTACLSLYVSYYKKKSIREREECDENVRSLLVLEASRIANDKLVRDIDDYNGSISSRLDSMESKMKKMSDNLTCLLKICPQMNDRKITYGTSDSMWPISSLSHGDLVIINYSLVDIINNSTIELCHSKHLHLTISGFPIPPTEILLPAGMRILITKASRVPRGIRDMENSIDLTNSAKAALEMCVIRGAR
jgi:hypothetical protein